MGRFADFAAVAKAELPPTPLARTASVFFSLSVLTVLFSTAASEGFLIAALLVYGGAWLREQATLVFPPIKLPLVLFCLATLLSDLGATDRWIGWHAIRKLILFIILALTPSLVRRGRHLAFLYAALFAEAALAAVVGVVQFVRQYLDVRAHHPGEVYFYMTNERIHGFMGHWMNFGGQQMLIFLAMSACLLAKFPPGTRGSPLALARTHPAEASQGSHALAWWVAFCLVATSLVLNFTRGVWLGCAAGVLYIMWRHRRRWLWALPILVVILVAGAPGLLRQRLRSVLHPARDPSISIRFEMWRVGVNMIKHHPWLGVGPDNIPEVYADYLPLGQLPMAGYHGHLHNDYLQLGAERGLPALGAWLWLMGALGWHIRKERNPSAALGWVADAALAGWLSILVEGFFEYNFGTSPVLALFLFVASTPFVAV